MDLYEEHPRVHGAGETGRRAGDGNAGVAPELHVVHGAQRY